MSTNIKIEKIEGTRFKVKNINEGRVKIVDIKTDNLTEKLTTTEGEALNNFLEEEKQSLEKQIQDLNMQEYSGDDFLEDEDENLMMDDEDIIEEDKKVDIVNNFIIWGIVIFFFCLMILIGYQYYTHKVEISKITQELEKERITEQKIINEEIQFKTDISKTNDSILELQKIKAKELEDQKDFRTKEQESISRVKKIDSQINNLESRMIELSNLY